MPGSICPGIQSRWWNFGVHVVCGSRSRSVQDKSARPNTCGLILHTARSAPADHVDPEVPPARLYTGTDRPGHSKSPEPTVAFYDFLWNNRDMNDGERTVAAIQSAEGQQLMYNL